ncbi:uncharacterized protein N7483_011561 [Penicillium malachiteum]|uniref:uncharacterized protein n=1 Tax=Penicillium malachiteum TaxID=1324776 RepID=UPI002546B1B8|nr:uncharacterized protein N7483_011561 [Penicillium malachiteum]KAJ5714380.1 hypothetical protein N7483_011561 [Penicillium malachiteum]
MWYFIEPPLTSAERAIVKTYGSWANFMFLFGLEPWDNDDVQEGKRILEAFAADDDE